MKHFFLVFLLLILSGCSSEPSNNDLKKILDQKNNKLKTIVLEKKILGVGVSNLLGVEDIKLLSVEKLKCIEDSEGSKLFNCDIAIKYSISASKTSIVDLIGMSGDNTEIRRLKLIKISNAWEVID